MLSNTWVFLQSLYLVVCRGLMLGVFVSPVMAGWGNEAFETAANSRFVKDTKYQAQIYSQTTASPCSGNVSGIAGMVHGHIFPSCGKNYLIFLFTSLLLPVAQKWLWLQVSTMGFVKTRKCYVRIPEPTLCLSIAYAIALRVAHLASQRLLPVQNIYRVLKMCIVCSIQKWY